MQHSKQSPHCVLWTETVTTVLVKEAQKKTLYFLRTLRKMSHSQQLLVSVYWCSYQVSSHTASWCGTVVALQQIKKSLQSIIKTKKNIINQQLPGQHFHLLVPAGDPEHPETLIRPCPSTFWTVALHYRSIKTCATRFDWLIDAFILNM